MWYERSPDLAKRDDQTREERGGGERLTDVESVVGRVLSFEEDDRRFGGESFQFGIVLAQDVGQSDHLFEGVVAAHRPRRT